MRKLKVVLYSFAGLIVVGIGLGVAAYLRFADEPEALLAVVPGKNGISLNNIRHVATRDGVKEWALDAQSARHIKEKDQTLFKKISATFFLKDDKSISIRGRDGILSNATKDMEVSGDVVVRHGPYKLNTERLHYAHKSQTISTQTPVTIKGNGIEITGNQLALYVQAEKVVISGKVNAFFDQQKQTLIRQHSVGT